MKSTNPIAIVVCVLFHQILGFVWYSVSPLAIIRLEALGKPPSDANVVDPVALGLDVAGWILATLLIAWLIQKMRLESAVQGAALGFMLWLGIAVPSLVPHYAFAGVSPIVSIIDTLNLLVALTVTGAVLAGWRKKTSRI